MDLKDAFMRGEKNLEGSNEMAASVFHRCVEDCSEPIMVSDRTGRLQYVNPSWVRTYGYCAEEALGSTPRLLRSNMQTDEFYQRMWAQILDPSVGVWKGEVVNRAKDGRLIPVFLTITPYRHEGEILGYMGIAVDLSERRHLERQILRQDRLASIGMLASSLAHEIGNPLGVIRGRAEIVLETLRHGFTGDPGGLGTRIGQSLETIVGQIDRISKLIDSLLKISRVPQELNLRELKLKPAVHEVATLVGETCKRKGIELVNQVDDVVVLGDPHHVQQVLLNLTINAIHAIEEETKRGGRTDHKITISTKTAMDGKISLFVKDTGCGVSAETKRRMFEPFFTTKAPGQGTGLGLAIVTKLIEEIQATIEVDSAGPGLGTTFTVHFAAPKSRPV